MHKELIIIKDNKFAEFRDIHCLPIFVLLFWMNRVDLDSTTVNVFYTDKIYGNLRNKRWLKFEIKLICNLPYSI